MTDSQGIDVLEKEEENQDQASSEETGENASALSQKEYEDITDLVLLMDEHDLAEVEFEGKHHRIRLKKQGTNPAPASAPRPAAPAPAGAQAPAAGTGEAAGSDQADSSGAGPQESGGREDENLKTIKAPLVGTFYRAPAPDADPFVEEGDEIDEDTVVCIIEAMKVMNEIKAETSGTVERILVNNGEAVDFDEPLIEISPSD